MFVLDPRVSTNDSVLRSIAAHAVVKHGIKNMPLFHRSITTQTANSSRYHSDNIEIQPWPSTQAFRGELVVSTTKCTSNFSLNFLEGDVRIDNQHGMTTNFRFLKVTTKPTGYLHRLQGHNVYSHNYRGFLIVIDHAHLFFYSTASWDYSSRK